MDEKRLNFSPKDLCYLVSKKYNFDYNILLDYRGCRNYGKKRRRIILN